MFDNRLTRFITSSIRNKLLLAFALLAIVPLVALGLFAWRTAEASLTERATAQLESVAVLQQNRIKELFQTYTDVVEIVAKDAEVQRRLELVTAAEVKGGDAAKPADGAKPADAGKDKAQQLAYLKERLQAILETVSGADTVQFMDTKGVILVDTLPPNETQKGKDKSKDLYYSGSLAAKGKAYFKPIYLSSTGRPSSAVGIMISDSSGKHLGFVVVRITLKKFDQILQERTGLGATGESYIAVDGLIVKEQKTEAGKLYMATDSRFIKEAGLKQAADTQGAKLGLKKESGSANYQNYRNAPVLGYYSYLPELDAALLTEIEEAEAFKAVTFMRWTIFIVVGAMSLVVIAVSFWLARGLTRQVRHINSTLAAVGMGDFDARVPVTSQDELGEVAITVNAMFDNTLSLIQSRDEKDQVQASIQKLLEEVSEVGKGDLTKEAAVSTDITGAIADSFNFMIAELRKIISNVQEATLQVSTSANQIQATAEHLASGSEMQSHRIVDTSAAIDEMAVSIQQVSDNAASSAKVADEALQNAKRGTEAVQNTLTGMTSIREQVQETAKRIKRLGESSQQIGEIVQLIEEIADRTSILSLNASIQSAMAGEAGRGFAVVAEEVERLAERSAGATKKIAGLIKNIQSETNEAVSAMENTTREVVQGSGLAAKAEQSLAEIDKVSKQLAELIQSITLASKQQARAADSVAKAMNEVSSITQQTAAGTRQTAVSVSDLATLADGLRHSVSRFRLPSRNGTTHDLRGQNDLVLLKPRQVPLPKPGVTEPLHRNALPEITPKSLVEDKPFMSAGNGASATAVAAPPQVDKQVSFKCPKCHRALRGNASWTGRQAHCPGCENNFTLTPS